VRQRAAALLMTGLLMTGLLIAGGLDGVSAMTYVSVDFPTLVREAQAIAIGRVAAVEPRWRAERRGIETALIVDVQHYLKGDFGPTVTLAVPGGQMGRYRSIVPGAPVFVEGEELILFLAADASGIARMLGLGQGVFRIMTDQASGVRLVVPEILRATQIGPTRIVRGDLARRPLPLEQFAGAVRAAFVKRAGR
jgi:hypothetical protein